MAPNFFLENFCKRIYTKPQKFFAKFFLDGSFIYKHPPLSAFFPVNTCADTNTKNTLENL